MEALLGMILIVNFIIGLFFAFLNRRIAKKRGYQGRRAFFGGLFFNIRGTIYCLMKDKTPEKMAEEYKRMKEMIG